MIPTEWRIQLTVNDSTLESMIVTIHVFMNPLLFVVQLSKIERVSI